MNTKKLFNPKIQNYKVKTQKYGLINYVNLDNAATTPPLLAVQKGVDDYLISYGSVHRGAGAKSKISTDAYEKSRQVIKDFVNAPKDNYVIFTTNTTEAINTAAYFFSFLSGKVAVSEVEHSSSWLPWIKAEGIKMFGSKQVSLNEVENKNNKIQELGRQQVVQYDVNEDFEFNLEDIEKILKENKIKVVVITAASNITGYCPDIKAVGELVHKYGAYFLVDGCQFIQHHKIDIQEMGIDFLVASGHKLYAPYGDGFLIGAKSFFDEFLPYQIGGGNLPYITQEGEFLRFKTQLAHDPGTPNAVGAVAMAIALKTLKEIGIANVEKHDQGLTAKLYDYLATNPKVELYVSREHLTTVIPFNLKGVNADEVAGKLNSVYGIGVRAGSFCAYKVVRRLLNITDETEIIKSVRAGNIEKVPALIRVSIGLCNTEKDINRMIEAIKDLTR
jgi:cysteine desulfurase